MKKITLPIINESGYDLPAYATPGSSGLDIRAVIDEPVTIAPGEQRNFDTKIAIQLPEGYEGQMRGRSGLNFKHGLIMPIGTIDSDYRGFMGVSLYNLSKEPFTVNPGDRIAQLVITPVVQAELDPVLFLDDVTERGTKGFGHSDMQ